MEKITDLPGIGATTEEKLITQGYDTLLAIAVSSPALISEASGLSEAKSRSIITAARSALNFGFITGTKNKQEREMVFRIPTGSKEFDALLNGGFESGVISECYGKFGSSKSQVAHQLCVNLQAMNPDYQAVYIDTEHSFRPKRIEEMAKGAGLDSKKILENVLVAEVFNSDHQMFMVDKAEELVKENSNIKLLIVDSIIDHFKNDFQGRGKLADRQQKLNRHMHTLIKLARLHNICIYITNQVMSDPAALYGDPIIPSGGNIIGHASRFRIYLRKSSKGITAMLKDAPDLADGNCIFQVTTDGIRD